MKLGRHGAARETADGLATDRAGAGVSVSPSTAFLPGRLEGWAVFGRVLRLVRRWPWLLGLALGSFALVAAGRLFLTWLVKVWADQLVTDNWRALLPLVAATAAAVLVMLSGTVFASRWASAALDLRLLEEIRCAALRALFATEIEQVSQRARGDVQTRLMIDTNELGGVVQEVLRRGLGDGLVALGSLAMLVWIDWRLCLAALVVAPVGGLLFDRLGRRVRQRSAKSRQRLGEVGALLQEQLAGWATIEEAGAGDHELRRFAELHREFRRETLRAELLGAGAAAVAWGVAGTMILVALAYGSVRVGAGLLTPGGLLAFCLFAAQGAEPLRRWGDLRARLERAFAAGSRIFEIFDLPARAPGSARLPTARGGVAIAFVAVEARYAAAPPVLSGLTFEVNPGECFGVVGASGSGKTTLARLLAGGIEPCSGSVLLEQTPVGVLDKEQLRRTVCFVSQEPFLWSGSVFDNVRYGAFSRTEHEAERALAEVGLAEWLQALPRGLHTAVQECGADLSGGQRQRLVLARALLRDPRLLILDEATNAVDSQIEDALLARLAEWLRLRTCIVLSHRWATIDRCDRVLMLQGGRRVALGTPAELVAQSLPYRRLFASQLAANSERTNLDGNERRLGS